MNSPLIWGLACGLVAAVLFASISVPTPLTYFLFYLTPLPVFLAGLGWGMVASLLAASSGGALTGVMMGNLAAVIFLIFAGTPPVLLCYLASLRRVPPPSPPSANNEIGAADRRPAVEWYPAGRVVAHAALLCGALTATALIMLGPDEESYVKAVKSYLDQVKLKEALTQSASLTPQEIERLTTIFANVVLPFIAGMLWHGITLLNFWFASKIVKFSNRLERPWPNFSVMQYPSFLLLGVGAALLASLAPGMVGIAAICILGGLAGAYLLIGLIVIRVVTKDWPLQSVLMIGIFLSVFLFGWPALLIIGVGLADQVLDLRKLRKSHQPPPAAAGGGGV